MYGLPDGARPADDGAIHGRDDAEEHGGFLSLGDVQSRSQRIAEGCANTRWLGAASIGAKARVTQVLDFKSQCRL